MDCSKLLGLSVFLVAGASQAATLGIVNGDFETGADGDAVIAGWDGDGQDPGFWLQNDNVGASNPDPTEGQGGSALYLSGNRLAGGAGTQPVSSTLSQTVALSAENLDLVATGFAVLELDFYYQDTDVADVGNVSVTFLGSGASELGSIATGDLPDVADNGTLYDPVDAPWTLVDLDGAIPTGTESVRIDINTGPRASGSATNVHFDSFSGAVVVPEPASLMLVGLGGVATLIRRRRA